MSLYPFTRPKLSTFPSLSSYQVARDKAEAGEPLTGARTVATFDYWGQPVGAELESLPLNYGGERWYFLCPDCGTRRVNLLWTKGWMTCRGCLDARY